MFIRHRLLYQQRSQWFSGQYVDVEMRDGLSCFFAVVGYEPVAFFRKAERFSYFPDASKKPRYFPGPGFFGEIIERNIFALRHNQYMHRRGRGYIVKRHNRGILEYEIAGKFLPYYAREDILRIVHTLYAIRAARKKQIEIFARVFILRKKEGFMIKEFKEFISRGNVIDLAVGIIMGAAFTGIVNSLVNDVIMPPIGYIMGSIDFSNLFLNLGKGEFSSLKAAKDAGAATVNYGVFINAVINFVIVSAAVFMLVKQVNRFNKKAEAAAIATPPRSEKLLEEIRDLLKK